MTETSTVRVRSLAPLWDVCFVAENDVEAEIQIRKQLDVYNGTVVGIDHIFAQLVVNDERGDLIDWHFAEPAPFYVQDMYDTEWEDDSQIAEWRVYPVDPDQIVVTDDGENVRLGDFADCAYFAPAVGTADGFGGERNHIGVNDTWSPPDGT